ncbi:MAG: HAMP domain-containing sensor histidine kinase, partial [Terriglobales bacterium]
EEMFDIAAREASRLERLTDDFLSYARPRPAERSANSVLDTLAYVASVCRAHASQKQVQLEVEASESLIANIDPAQVQQALLNLVMNAVDACSPGKRVLLKASYDGFAQFRIDVENPGGPIPQQALLRIFEPFFTTKPKGTGLGLAIARNIARNHGGDLVLTSNTARRVCFSVMLPMNGTQVRTKG